MTSGVCLLFFVRAPVPGRVKTRLARDVGPDAAARLYRACVEDMLDVLDAQEAQRILCVEPGEGVPEARRWLGARRAYLPQQGADLGQRLENAFAWAFAQGFDATAAVGSDVPGLTPDAAARLVEGLRAGRACLGPSPDGGYWAIGFTRENFLPQAFQGMPWSTPDLQRRTLEVLAPLDPLILPELADVDTLADLGRALAACPAGLAARTRREALALAGQGQRAFTDQS